MTICGSPGSSRRVYLTVLAGMAFLMIAIACLLHEVNRLNRRYRPILHAAVQSEAELGRAQAQLDRSGDGPARQPDLARAQGHLAQARSHARRARQGLEAVAGASPRIVGLLWLLLVASPLLACLIVAAFRCYAGARKRLEEALFQARRDAEHANQCKTDFLTNMSHEMRTPLTAILGYADLLAEEPDAVDACVAAEIVRRNGAHLLDLINDILDLSKIEAGKHETKLAACSPAQIVGEVVALMRIRAEAKGLTLAACYEGPIPETITSDPIRLRQILLNIVGNAVKFTEVGEIRVVARLVEGPGEPRMQFDVIDTGVGIAEDEQQQLFSPFAQGHSARRGFGGTGLGLAISRRLARILGGDIEVTSRLGEGSTFRITVATGSLEGVCLIDGNHLTAPNDRPEGHGREGAPRLPGRILLAEDGPDNRRFISLVLRMAGAEVTVADNGRAAVDLALKAEADGTPFDLIIMDMQMPILDGYEATRQLRQAGFTRPIIALTAYAMRDDMGKCLAAGCDAYASKPVDRERLLMMLHDHLGPDSGTPSPRPDATQPA